MNIFKKSLLSFVDWKMVEGKKQAMCSDLNNLNIV